jgi:hypothetical protein
VLHEFKQALSELAIDFQNGNIQSLRTKLFKAQRKITEVLKQRWTASNLKIQLRHESEFIYIDIVNSINHDVVDIRERSEGFQWFLCVIAALEGVRTNTSGSSLGKDRVQPFQLHHSIHRSKLPINPHHPSTPIRHPTIRHPTISHTSQHHSITNPFT